MLGAYEKLGMDAPALSDTRTEKEKLREKAKHKKEKEARRAKRDKKIADAKERCERALERIKQSSENGSARNEKRKVVRNARDKEIEGIKEAWRKEEELLKLTDEQKAAIDCDKNKKRLRFETEDVSPNPEAPGIHATEHLEPLLKGIKDDNRRRGGLLEVCVADALVVFRDGDHRIEPRRVELHLDMHPPYSAEADIMIRPSTELGETHVLFLKTSFRERKKQADRDASYDVMRINMGELNRIVGFREDMMLLQALVIYMNSPERKTFYHAIFYQEHSGDTLEKVRCQAQRIKKKEIFLDSVISILDNEALTALFKRIVHS